MLDLHLDGIRAFLKKVDESQLICYGVGGHFFRVLDKYQYTGIEEKIEAIVDKDEAKYNQLVKGKKREWRINGLTEFADMALKGNIVILITVEKKVVDVIKYLDFIKELDGICTYISSFLEENISEDKVFNYISDPIERIPRIIHYCWFGKAEMPPKYKNYIESWKKNNPEYEIKRWDESNYDISKSRYATEAYSRGKWAFVSDFARIDIVNEYGGIYLDCDVEALKCFDPLLNNKFFCGFENNRMVALGLGFGSVAHHPYLEELIGLYQNLSFLRNDGSMDLTPCTIYQTSVIKRYGIEDNGEFQQTKLMTVFPKNVFAPVSYYQMGNVTETSFSIHHYDASWLDGDYMDYWQSLRISGKWIYERYKMQGNN